jgi:hypothetical protein
LLQLSPTNEVQGRSAVQFAAQRGERHFLVVLGNDPNDKSYTDNMSKAYSDAIHAAQAELLGVYPMNALPSESDFERWKPELAVLYAGSVGEAQTLFSRLSAMKLPGVELTVILSDSVIQSRGTDADLAAFSPAVPGDSVSPLPKAAGRLGPIEQAAQRERMPTEQCPRVPLVAEHGLPVNFTYQTDANDYNSHTNPYVDDGFSIALQLIHDLNDRGGDIGLRVRSRLHMENVNNARRNLLRVMRQNSNSRTWYKSASGRPPYVFEGHKQYGGIFHVWRVRPSSQPGGEMDDVDNWHPPRPVADLRGHKTLAVQK